ncbi:hypothetical protein LCGC14_0829180 [marine sediment metagenome]|uniref:Uncharacterized protein n=1 Tax=marine sediment metagenome TaxID=412755 RepID=A0A0F9Q1Q4_9ZZZZ
MDFPQPQTLGRTRGVNTVPSDPNAGLIARPTAYEAQSFFEQVSSYVNNYFGSIPTAQAVKGVQSQQKAAPIGNATPSVFSTISERLTGRPIEATWKTIADKIIDDRGLVIQSDYPGAKVPGPIPAPRVQNYSGADTRSVAWSDIRRGGEAFVNQVKGLFNLSYSGPQEQSGIPIEEHKGLGLYRDTSADETAAAALLALVLLG